ncbi:MAG: hypothetical protein KDD64_15915, partial [Bdellovibrionales bacterium]|nr:hypothetical protein [Bdellovibrionales bacterium]
YSPSELQKRRTEKDAEQSALTKSMEELLPMKILGCPEIIGKPCSKYEDGLRSNCTQSDGSDAYLCCASNVPDGPLGRWLECDWNDEDGVVGCDSVLSQSCEKKNEPLVCAEGAFDYLALQCITLSTAERAVWTRSPLPLCGRHLGSPCVKGSFLCLGEEEKLNRLCCSFDAKLGERSYLPCGSQ